MTEELVPGVTDDWKVRLAQATAELKEEIMSTLSEKIDVLSAAVSKLSARLDTRKALRSVGERLESIEENLQSGRGELDRLTDTISELSNTHEAIDNLKERMDELPDVTSSVENARDRLVTQLESVQEFLRSGQDRRKMRRALIHGRILELRDGLRDQLEISNGKPAETSSSLLANLAGKAKNSVRVTDDEMAGFRNLIEGILEGLEFLIYELHDDESPSLPVLGQVSREDSDSQTRSPEGIDEPRGL